MRTYLKTLKVLMLGICLSMSSLAWSNTVEEEPTALAMTADTLFARPALLATTILGAGVFIISSPFSALGNNIEETWDVLVKRPFEATFVRCVGCTLSGRKANKVVEQEN